MSHTVIILNPWAGRGAAGARRGEIESACRAAGIDARLVITHARGGATELAWQAIEGGARRVVAVGGDGTINEVVNGIKGAEATGAPRASLGIIPLGTGSDFVKMLERIPANDVAAAVARLAADETRSIDLGQIIVGDAAPRHFINAIGIGFDAQVAAEALKITRLRGLAVYLTAIIRALANYRAHPMEVVYDESRLRRRLMFANVANGRCQGAGFWMTPDAAFDDGLLDLCLVDRLRLDQIIRYIPRLMEGSHTSLREVTMGRGAAIEIRCQAPMPVQADGEVLATDAREVRVAVLPGALDVVV